MFNIVKVHNNFAQNAQYNISETGKNILYMVLGMYKENQTVDTVYEIFLKDMALVANKSINYHQFKTACEELSGRIKGKSIPTLFVDLPDGKKQSYPFFKMIEYQENEGYIKVVLNDELKPLWDNLTKNFTLLNLQQGMALTGKYTKRIFDYISSIRNFKDHYGKYPYIDLLEFKNLMHLSEEDYSKFGIFRVRILDKAIKEINKYSDFNVRYTPVKKGRKIIGLTWQISKNPKKQSDILEYEVVQYFRSTIVKLNSVAKSLKDETYRMLIKAIHSGEVNHLDPYEVEKFVMETLNKNQ